MTIETYIVDAFTDKPFSGNPAGVCILKEKLHEDILQAIAAELNYSETAFLEKTNGNNQFAIRYFTPTTEIDFCGHATLASSKVLLDKKGFSHIELSTRTALKLSASKDKNGIVMKFPLYENHEYEVDPMLITAFNIPKPTNTRFCQDLKMVIIELDTKENVLAINPNYQMALDNVQNIDEVVITSKSNDDLYDFYSRCFCPWIGINEDPVTGAAHSVLAKYWGDKLGKTKMKAYQLSKRGGFLSMKIINATSLQVTSQAQIVFEGLLNVPELQHPAYT